MRELFRQVRESGKGSYPYLALAGALIIPDLCGAMDAANGRATGARYARWFDAHVADRYTVRGEVWLTGQDCYRLRCSLLHQGTTAHPAGTYTRFIFTEHHPDGIRVHMNRMDDDLNLGIPEFTRDMAEAGVAWLDRVEQTPLFQQNYSRFLRRYPEGVPGNPINLGVPMIA